MCIFVVHIKEIVILTSIFVSIPLGETMIMRIWWCFGFDECLLLNVKQLLFSFFPSIAPSLVFLFLLWKSPFVGYIDICEWVHLHNSENLMDSFHCFQVVAIHSFIHDILWHSLSLFLSFSLSLFYSWWNNWNRTNKNRIRIRIRIGFVSMYRYR